ncbi:putative lipid II flippase FtsW [Prescottella agglutinans]|uniref:Probable peptidoglycan glycosyltransferase FtsW n=1 Tax=Prescottella agglutinans TaxID=1644129 RepID=A0ABT6MAP4_9NOCA|nr:putative lipid II flippase FtsW [Prescottella agglutinans]MDH6281371.1 cell division protein FtsW [Prescottella agglutinans]
MTARSGQAPAPKSEGTTFRRRFAEWTERPLWSLHLTLGLTGLLTTFGLAMVLSASAVESYVGGGSAYTFFVQQLLGVVLGLFAFYLAMRLPVRTIRMLSFPAFVVSVVMLVLVLIPGIGTEIQGSRRWFDIAGISFQPSELAKVALVLWGAHMLTLRGRTDRSTRDIVIPVVPGALVMCVLVVLQPNLSTAITLAIIMMALLWYVGFDLRILSAIIATGVATAIILTFTAGYRVDRVRVLFNPGDDPQGLGYQSRQAKYALASGGVFGEGLGQSTSKWNYLPNAYNDFIFAIIGDELGIIGCLSVVALFAAVVLLGLRIARRCADPFLGLVAAVATTWIGAQAAINIGYVTGLLPVTGLQLPLISYGGTSTALMLFVFGLIANAARHEPRAIAAIEKSGGGRISRLLRLPVPQPSPTPDSRRVQRRRNSMPPNMTRGREPSRRSGSTVPSDRTSTVRSRSTRTAGRRSS